MLDVVHILVAYWNQVVIMNDWQKSRFANNMISSMFNNVTGKKIAIFGFAFKANTGDTRETPAVHVIKTLLGDRAKIHIYDPKVEKKQILHDFDEYKVEKCTKERRALYAYKSPM